MKKIIKPRVIKKKEDPVKPQGAKKTAPKAAAKKEKTVIFYGLHNIGVPLGAHKKRKVVGRGSGSGHGKTSTRGSKGQTSRSGKSRYLGFEGGQMPFIRRIPKRGFNSRSTKRYQLVNVGDLNKIKETNINIELLKKCGLIKDAGKLVKILGDGELKSVVTVSAHAFSKSAEDKIKNSGGKIEIVNV